MFVSRSILLCFSLLFLATGAEAQWARIDSKDYFVPLPDDNWSAHKSRQISSPFSEMRQELLFKWLGQLTSGLPTTTFEELDKIDTGAAARVDSLQRQMSGKVGYDALVLEEKIFAEYESMHELDSVLASAQRMYSIQGLDSCNVTRVYLLNSLALFWLHRYDAATEVMKKGLRIAGESSCMLVEAKLWNISGIISVYQGEYRNAIIKFLKSLLIRRTLGNKEVELVYNSIGLTFYKLRDYHTALKYYLMADSLSPERDALFKTNIGICYLHSNHSQKGILYNAEGLKISHLDPGQRDVVAGAYYGLGLACLQANQIEAAERYFKISLTCANKFHDLRFQAENLTHLSRIYQGRSQWDSSYQVLATAKLIAEEGRLAEIMLDVLRQQVNTAGLSGDVKAMSRYLNDFINQKAKLYPADLSRAIAWTEARRMDEELEETIARQQALISTRSDAIKIQGSFVLAISLFGVTVLTMLLVAVRQFQLKKSLGQKLSRMVDERTREILHSHNDLAFRYSRVTHIKTRMESMDWRKDTQINGRNWKGLHSFSS